MAERKATVLANFLLYQAGWFVCVAGGASQRPWMGLLAVLPIVALHLLRADDHKAELKLVVSAVAIGAVFDGLLVWSQWLAYPSGVLFPNTAPYWILAIWALFATVLNLSLRWLRGRKVAAAIAGGIGGPLAYYAGHRMGAVEFSEPAAALMALGLGWAVLTPLLMALAERYDGYPRLARQEAS